MKNYEPMTEAELQALRAGSTDEEFAAVFPVCAAVTALGDQFQNIKAFLEWLSWDESGLILCDNPNPNSEQERFWPTDRRNRSIVYDYFELDEKAHDTELQRMLECCQMMNTTPVIVEVPNDAR